MRVLYWAPMVLSLIACGDSPPPEVPADTASEASATSNQPPVITSVELAPPTPRPGEAVAVKTQVNDPEGDRIELHFDWYVDGRLFAGDAGSYLETGELERGARIHVVVRASDGTGQSERQTGVAVVQNETPRITGIALHPSRPTATDTVLAEVLVEDREGDSYQLAYAWLVNGSVLEGETRGTLPPGKAKRGDEIAVRVIASDRESSAPMVSQSIVLANANPKITSEPATTLASERGYRYQVQAEDPDGDRPLRYELVEGPDGMTVDLVDGVVEWEVPLDADGRFPIEIAVHDSYGGESSQRYMLDFHWEDVPASAADEDRDDSDEDVDEDDDDSEDDDE